MATYPATEDEGVESTDVNNAIDHLHELAHLCQSSGSRVQLIDEVVAILKDMDVKRLAAHEALEAETIACSMLRHQVATFPDRLKAELAAATGAARQSNAAQLKELQEKLGNISQNDDGCHRRNEVLELHNEVLSTEEKSLSVRYNDLMKKLNKSMLEKSNARIVLNETRNSLSTTQHQIASAESRLIQLDQSIIRERESFHKEKISLAKDLETVNKRCEENTKADVQLKKELISLENSAVETELEAEDKRNACCKLEARIKRLNAKHKDVEEQLREGEEETERLNNEQKDIIRQRDEMVKMFAEKKEEMIQKTEQYVKEIATCTAEAKKLAGGRKLLKREHKKAQEEANMQNLTLKDIQENVNTSKRTLMFQADEASRLVGMNHDLELGLVQLNESHKVSVTILREQINKLKDQLVRERQLRQEVMEELLELQKVKEKEHVEQTRSFKEATAEVKKQKHSQDEMSQKMKLLHKDIEQHTNQTEDLTKALRAAKQHLDQLIASLSQQKSSLETQITSMQNTLADIDKQYETVMPQLSKLEEEYNEITGKYEAKKKDIVVVKNKQTGIEERIARAKKTLSKMHIPQEELRMNILRCRAYTRQNIRQHSTEVDQLEHVVNTIVHKLNIVRKENERLKEITEVLKEETTHLSGITDSREQVEAGATSELNKCRESLQQAWVEDHEMDEQFAKLDTVILDEIDSVREASRNRQDRLQDIQKRFDKELSVLKDFVEVLATS